MNLVEEINEYLANGGLFNPELADHHAVRDLLIECREEIIRLEYERPPKGFVRVPTTKAEALLMVKIGTLWLEQTIGNTNG